MKKFFKKIHNYFDCYGVEILFVVLILLVLICAAIKFTHPVEAPSNSHNVHVIWIPFSNGALTPFFIYY